MPLAGLGDGPKTGAAIALREVADTTKVQLSGPHSGPDSNELRTPRPDRLAIHGLQNRRPTGLRDSMFLDTKLAKIVPSGSGDKITYSFGLHNPTPLRPSGPVFATGHVQLLGNPFGDKIFSLKDNAAFTSVKRIESIAKQFGEGWDYSILHAASVPSVKGGAKDSTLYAELWTDVASAGENDYMVGGWWLLAPNNPAGDYRFGVLAKPEKYYPRSGQGSIKAGVTGSATYKGNAAGLHTSSENGIQRLLGKVTLNADFKGTTERGTIEGRINSLTLDGESVRGGILLPKATLGASTTHLRFPAPITDSTADKNLNRKVEIGNIDGTNYKGDWAGTFQGDPSGTDQPTGIVGVVGGSGGGNSFVASFGAKKVENE